MSLDIWSYRSRGQTNKNITDKLKCDVVQCFSLGVNREKFCDFTIVVGDREFPCHRFVLSACSGFFEALLRSDMKELRDGKANIHEISPEIFKLILDAIYGGFEVMTSDTMINIWKAAHQLQIPVIITACEDYFESNIDANNYYLLYTYAHFLQAPKVSNSVINYIITNFDSVFKSDNFLKIKYEDFFKIIKCSFLTSEDNKIEAILKWCSSENKNNKSDGLKPGQGLSRLPYLGDLIKNVNLAQLSAQCLAGLLTNKHVRDDKTVNVEVYTQAAKNLVSQKEQIVEAKNKVNELENRIAKLKVCPYCRKR